jgi:5'-nucleotidase
MVRITLLQVNDVYQFTPVDGGLRGGLARVSTIRKQVALDSPNILFLLAGDTISPSAESITYKGQQMIDAWNAVGLDYAVFGNHEFDYGDEVLRQRILESQFKWLAANVVEKKTGLPFAGAQPYVIREFAGVKVGLLGLVLPETAKTSRPGPNLDFQPPCEAALRFIPKMKESGAQVIVGLTHLSMSEDKELARCAPLDVIIGGHEHTLLQSFAGRTPIFKMTANAREVGRIDLNVDTASGKLQSIDWEIIPVTDQIADDPQFAPVRAKYDAIINELAKPAGRTRVALDARSASNRTRETNLGSFAADAFRAATGADVALINGGSVRADAIIEPGALTLRDIVSIFPFGNEVVTIRVSGETLRGALEHGVSRTADGAEPGQFPQVSGIRYTFDASRPPGARVTEVTVNGRLLAPKSLYTLAVNSFVAGGGDGYAMFSGAPNVGKARLTDLEILRKAISSTESIAPAVDGRIKRLDQ